MWVQQSLYCFFEAIIVALWAIAAYLAYILYNLLTGES